MKSILLVDGDAIISAQLQKTLQHFGFHVEVANTVESARSRTKKKLFDVILLEFNLKSKHRSHPETGLGVELVRQLRKLKITVPILIYTVMEGELYETTSLDAGADDYLLKTTSEPCLLSRLHAHIGKYERELGKTMSGSRHINSE